MADATAPDMETEREPPVPGAIAFVDDKWLCPDCSKDGRVCCELVKVDCEDCGGDGLTPEGYLYDLDPLWYDPDDTDPCGLCRGAGVRWVCSGECDANGRHKGADDVP